MGKKTTVVAIKMVKSVDIGHILKLKGREFPDMIKVSNVSERRIQNDSQAF